MPSRGNLFPSHAALSKTAQDTATAAGPGRPPNHSSSRPPSRLSYPSAPPQDPGDRPDAYVPGRPPCGGSDSTATGQSEERGGERKKDRLRRAGRGERHSRTRAGDDGKGGRNGPLPEGGPHKGPRDRSGVGPVRAREAKPAGITLHHSPEQSHHTCSAEPTRNTTAPREPEEATPTRERDRCRHTDAYRRRPPSGSGSPRPTSRRTRPTAVLPQNGPVPESEINQRQTRTLSTPRRGRRTPAISPAVGTLPREGGARRHNHTAREAHSTHHARRRPASRERPKSWTRARGTHATEGTGEAREDGWGPGSPPSPTHTPSRTAALRRGGKYRARGGVHGALSPATTTQPEPHGSAATAGRQTGSAPRDPSPNSERGGAGRGRRESKRCARGRRSGGEPSRGPFGRDPSRP